MNNIFCAVLRVWARWGSGFCLCASPSGLGAVGRWARLGLSLGAEAQRRLEREREREQHAQQWRERKRR